MATNPFEALLYVVTGRRQKGGRITHRLRCEAFPGALAALHEPWVPLDGDAARAPLEYETFKRVRALEAAAAATLHSRPPAKRARGVLDPPAFAPPRQGTRRSPRHLPSLAPPLAQPVDDEAVWFVVQQMKSALGDPVYHEAIDKAHAIYRACFETRARGDPQDLTTEELVGAGEDEGQDEDESDG